MIVAVNESNAVAVKSLERVRDLVIRSKLDESDQAEALINLHIFLESSINAFFRGLFRLTQLKLKHDYGELVASENIDGVGVIDKVRCFIHFGQFDFPGDVSSADIQKHYGIIGKLAGMRKVRNQLVHGHSISSIYDGSLSRDSKARKNLKLEVLSKQLASAEQILDGLKFFLNYYSAASQGAWRDSLAQEYLDNSQLPKLIGE